MDNNRESTAGGTVDAVPTYAQGTNGGGRGPTTPFTMAAASGAARRMREQQRALKETLSSSAKTVKE